jgi:threonine synthase
MKLYNTKNATDIVSFKEAVFRSQPQDGGLYMPESLPRLSDEFIKNLKSHSFESIAYEVSRNILRGAIGDSDLKKLVEDAINFPAPVVSLDADTHILELFHGPSLAFKDFGARFMARVMSHFRQPNEGELVILVATSGDTGGAVAAGFHRTEGIKVVILYPSGKVSDLQEKQLTTLGDNVVALEVQGTFDDCQDLVKAAFKDAELSQLINLSSANSINIARLIPQSFYYFEAFKQLPEADKPVVFVVPSGNFGNMTAGLFAKRMGLPIHQFVAATNANNSVPKYLATGKFEPMKRAIPTLSNAMDVGNPSNFQRMENLYGSTWNMMKADIVGCDYDDAATKQAMQEVFSRYNYIIDPHGAVGYLALRDYQKHTDAVGVVLETAHPAKFLPDVEAVLGQEIPVPDRLDALKNKKKKAILMDTDFESFKDWLWECY